MFQPAAAKRTVIATPIVVLARVVALVENAYPSAKAALAHANQALLVIGTLA